MEPHKILGIKKDATEEQINRTYKKLAKKYHPDQSGKNTKSKFQKIKEAKEEMIKKKKALIKR